MIAILLVALIALMLGLIWVGSGDPIAPGDVDGN